MFGNRAASALTIGMWPMAASKITLHRLTNQRSEWTHLSCRTECVHSGHRQQMVTQGADG